MAWPNGTRLKDFVAGGSYLPTDANNVEDRMLQIAGHRGVSIIATEEARTNTAYGTLTTPDIVEDIVLPENGLLCVAFVAEWKESVTDAARAAIFLGANQLKVARDGATAPAVQEARLGGSSDITGSQTAATAPLYRPLVSHSLGLTGISTAAVSAYTGDVTTGQVIGGIEGANGTDSVVMRGGACLIHAAAGTYDISVQYKSTSGSVTAKNRKLWVWTEAFA